MTTILLALAIICVACNDESNYWGEGGIVLAGIAILYEVGSWLM